MISQIEKLEKADRMGNLGIEAKEKLATYKERAVKVLPRMFLRRSQIR